jgi:hypothetical protein
MPLHPALQGKKRASREKRDFGGKERDFWGNDEDFSGACKVLWIVWKITSDRVML